MRNVSFRPLLWALPIILWALPAAAQDERVRVSFGTAAVTGTRDGNMALNGSIGYRFAERLSFEFDLTATESPVGVFADRRFAIGGISGPIARGGVMMGDRSPRFAGGPVGPGTRFDVAGRFPGGPQELFDRRETFTAAAPGIDGRTVLATVGFRYDLPIQGGRLQPYVGGGIGIARTSTELSFIEPMMALRPDAEIGRLGLRDSADMGMAAAAGVGTSLRLYKALFVDVDARYFRLEHGRNLARLGGGVSYRF